jgi:hypothetical protein
MDINHYIYAVLLIKIFLVCYSEKKTVRTKARVLQEDLEFKASMDKQKADKRAARKKKQKAAKEKKQKKAEEAASGVLNDIHSDVYDFLSFVCPLWCVCCLNRCMKR